MVVRERGMMKVQRERCQWAIRPRAAVPLVVLLTVVGVGVGVRVVGVGVKGSGKHRLCQSLVNEGARGEKGRVSRWALDSVQFWTAFSVGGDRGKVGQEGLLLLLVLVGVGVGVVGVVVMVLVVVVEGKGVGSNSSSSSSSSNNYHIRRRLR